MSAWDRLIAELAAHNEWYGDHPGMSAYVGVTEKGEFFSGAHVGGEVWFDDDGDQNYQFDGDSPEAVIEPLILRLREYRVERDRERAEERDPGE